MQHESQFKRVVTPQSSITIESTDGSRLVANLTVDDRNQGVATLLDERHGHVLMRIPAEQITSVSSLLHELARNYDELSVTVLGDAPDVAPAGE